MDVLAASSANIAILNTTITDLLFSNASTTSQAYIGANNTIGRLEYRGRGSINGTGNTIETLIFAPGRIYTFLSGSTNTITKDWFGSGTPCNLTEISSSAAGAFTVNKTTGSVEFDYVRLRNITAVGNAGNTQFKALEHSEDLGGNTNWSILPYNNTTLYSVWVQIKPYVLMLSLIPLKPMVSLLRQWLLLPGVMAAQVLHL